MDSPHRIQADCRKYWEKARIYPYCYVHVLPFFSVFWGLKWGMWLPFEVTLILHVHVHIYMYKSQKLIISFKLPRFTIYSTCSTTRTIPSALQVGNSRICSYLSTGNCNLLFQRDLPLRFSHLKKIMTVPSSLQQYPWGLWSDQEHCCCKSILIINIKKIKVIKRNVSYLILHTDKLQP